MYRFRPIKNLRRIWKESARHFRLWWNLLWRPEGPNAIVLSSYGPMIINLKDQYIGRAVRLYGAWMPAELDTLQLIATQLIARHSSIAFYDVGANIGTHTLALATLFRGKIKIRAFEPQPSIFQMLCGTLAINNIFDADCHCVLVAATSNDVVKIRMPDYTVENNFGGLEFLKIQNSDNQNLRKSDREVNVPTVALDSFEEPVHLIKIDVEGMEDTVLRGAKKTITKYRPVCMLEINKTYSVFVMNFFKNLDYKIEFNGDCVLAIPVESCELLEIVSRRPK